MLPKLFQKMGKEDFQFFLHNLYYPDDKTR